MSRSILPVIISVQGRAVAVTVPSKKQSTTSLRMGVDMVFVSAQTITQTKECIAKLFQAYTIMIMLQSRLASFIRFYSILAVWGQFIAVWSIIRGQSDKEKSACWKQMVSPFSSGVVILHLTNKWAWNTTQYQQSTYNIFMPDLQQYRKTSTWSIPRVIFQASGYNRPNRYILYFLQSDIFNKGRRAALPATAVTSKFIMLDNDSFGLPFCYILL